MQIITTTGSVVAMEGYEDLEGFGGNGEGYDDLIDQFLDARDERIR